MRDFRTVILFASLVLHILLALLLRYFVPPESLKIDHPSYVEFLSPPKSPSAAKSNKRSEDERFVRKTQVPDKDLTTKKQKARFASEDEQNVLEEQRARLNDMTANRSADGKRSAKQAVLEKRGQNGTSDKHSNLKLSPTTPLEAAKERLLQGKSANPAGDIKVAGLAPKPAPDAERERGTENPTTVPSVGAQERGFSTVGEMLPDDIKFGDFTALNTDRHLFYSFYARMEELIRYRWVTYARAAVAGVTPQMLRQQGKENFLTKVEVVLDPKGRLVRTIVHEGSGLQNLDEAPVKAFTDVGSFPNPPAEMVKEDGFIHIYYAFNVNMVASALPNER